MYKRVEDQVHADHAIDEGHYGESGLLPIISTDYMLNLIDTIVGL